VEETNDFPQLCPIRLTNGRLFHYDRHFCPVGQMPVAFQDDDTVFDDTLENSLHFRSPHLQRNFTPILPCQAINGQHFNAQAFFRH
jgi:hypothetical protein